MQYHEVLYHLQGDSDLVFPELCEANQHIRVCVRVCVMEVRCLWDRIRLVMRDLRTSIY